jgi:adenosylhomocysteine nucleosidase
MLRPVTDRPGSVGLLAPMPSEHAPLVRRLGLSRAADDPTGLHRGTHAGITVVVDRTGIGTEGARRTTQRLLDTEPVEHVMVVGIAGGIGTTRVGDLVVPEVVVDHATGREYRSTPLGGRPAAGTIVTSDELLVDPVLVARLVDEGAIALDMETAAVAEVCDARGVPWCAVRVISDLATDHVDDSVMQLTNPDGTPNTGAALRYVLTNPWHVPRQAKLAKGANLAARRAADAAADALATR